MRASGLNVEVAADSVRHQESGDEGAASSVSAFARSTSTSASSATQNSRRSCSRSSAYSEGSVSSNLLYSCCEHCGPPSGLASAPVGVGGPSFAPPPAPDGMSDTGLGLREDSPPLLGDGERPPHGDVHAVNADASDPEAGDVGVVGLLTQRCCCRSVRTLWYMRSQLERSAAREDLSGSAAKPRCSNSPHEPVYYTQEKQVLSLGPPLIRSVKMTLVHRGINSSQARCEAQQNIVISKETCGSKIQYTGTLFVLINCYLFLLYTKYRLDFFNKRNCDENQIQNSIKIV